MGGGGLIILIDLFVCVCVASSDRLRRERVAASECCDVAPTTVPEENIRRLQLQVTKDESDVTTFGVTTFDITLDVMIGSVSAGTRICRLMGSGLDAARSIPHRLPIRRLDHRGSATSGSTGTAAGSARTARHGGSMCVGRGGEWREERECGWDRMRRQEQLEEARAQRDHHARAERRRIHRASQSVCLETFFFALYPVYVSHTLRVLVLCSIGSPPVLFTKWHAPHISF